MRNHAFGGFLAGRKKVQVHTPAAAEDMFKHGRIVLKTEQIHTVKPLSAVFPQGRLSVVTGVSGSGKTTLILESLIPALEAQIGRTSLPAHVKSITADS